MATAEREELISFSDRIEEANPRRLAYLVDLARLRQTSLETVLQELGFKALACCPARGCNNREGVVNLRHSDFGFMAHLSACLCRHCRQTTPYGNKLPSVTSAQPPHDSQIYTGSSLVLSIFLKKIDSCLLPLPYQYVALFTDSSSIYCDV
ncbi:MAG: hypothetical protein ACE5OR_07460 [bacterium]